MSSDKKAKDSWKPSENGAVTFLLKPLTYEEVIKFSLYAEQYKNRLDKGKFNESQSSGPKKERVKWTHDLHSKFVNAIQELGPERCSGKNILKIMNEPGLTRTQVNSHLQVTKGYIINLFISHERVTSPPQDFSSPPAEELLTPILTPKPIFNRNICSLIPIRFIMSTIYPICPSGTTWKLTSVHSYTPNKEPPEPRFTTTKTVSNPLEQGKPSTHFSAYQAKTIYGLCARLFVDIQIVRSENQSLMVDKEPQQNPPPSPATPHINNNMSRYEAIKVPILKIHEYPIWKVKMVMCLEVTDLEYLSRIYDDPHRPMKLVIADTGEEETMVDKINKDYTTEDPSSIMKDAKVINILYSSLDTVISNSVIGCKITKEICDALEVKCQCPSDIKKNRMTVLTPEYELFDSKDNEFSIEIYDRFQKLLYDLSLVNNEYDLEDSNLKFLLAFPEKWDFKTHELEIEQRSKRNGSKSRPIALKVEEKPKEKARRKGHSKGKAIFVKSDTDSSNSYDDSNTDSESDTDSDHDNNEDIEQMADVLVISFKKMVYKNFKKEKRKDLIKNAQGLAPVMLDYKIHDDNNSLYDSPPCYGIYMCELLFEDLLAQGGLGEGEFIKEAAKMNMVQL
ncbi:hypothetical protein AgCh_000332 [Apium graveolens]